MPYNRIQRIHQNENHHGTWSLNICNQQCKSNQKNGLPSKLSMPRDVRAMWVNKLSTVARRSTATVATSAHHRRANNLESSYVPTRGAYSVGKHDSLFLNRVKWYRTHQVSTYFFPNFFSYTIHKITGRPQTKVTITTFYNTIIITHPLMLKTLCLVTVQKPHGQIYNVFKGEHIFRQIFMVLNKAFPDM